MRRVAKNPTVFPRKFGKSGWLTGAVPKSLPSLRRQDGTGKVRKRDPAPVVLAIAEGLALPMPMLLLWKRRKDVLLMQDRARADRVVAGDDNVDMTQIYVQVVGVDKQCLFGSGSNVEAYVDLGPSACPPPIDEGAVRRRVTQELQQQFTQQMAERDARLQQQLDAHWREIEQQMQAMQTQMMDELCRRGPFPPPGLDA
ncbi:hypothetical protein PHJA_002451900 [Phtheirospermum japonicum]|uniref:Uncharacterized protein n=1 Tax=Phtheirospermum japonicum TaxID=374723 RepID=A0A830CT82_9LAMI|nr:hypothetical protein PHJA_002451900 [Phtheirospermum japonicum]